MEYSLENLLEKIFEEKSLLSATLSSPVEKMESSKNSIRPVTIKGVLHYQLSEQKGAQIVHRNLDSRDCLAWISSHAGSYKQILICTASNDYQILTSRKGKISILKKPPSKAKTPLQHNRTKNYLLPEGVPIPFMVQLGLMSHDGKVTSKMGDKFRQINRFLEMVDDVIPYLDQQKRLRIVDFGCGKAYLTFALYHYLKSEKKLNVELIGLDLKKEVIAFCQTLAQKLGYQNDLHFEVGDIQGYRTDQPVDAMISLHACDTATDAALEKAIGWGAKVILAVPCCQHELFNLVNCSGLEPLLKHGILKERFAALATDAMRAQILELMGYQVQVLEFIETEHTPKNLMIRAIKAGGQKDRAHDLEAYLKMKELIHAAPCLDKLVAEMM